MLTRLKACREFDALFKAVRAGGAPARAEGVPGAARGVLAAALAAETGRPVIAVAPDLETARAVADEAASLLPAGAARLLPDRDLAPYEPGPLSPQIAALRLAALPRLPGMADGVVVTTAAAWVEAVPAPDRLAGREFAVGFGDVVEREELLRHLVAVGYRRVDVVETAGEFAARGGIVDVFAPAAGRPLRIELDGDTAASLRWFDPDTQRSLEEVERVLIGPAAEMLLTAEERRALLERLPDPLSRRGGQRVARLRERLEEGASLEGEERYLPWLLPEAVRLPAYLPRDAVVMTIEPPLIADAWNRLAARTAALHEELARAREPAPAPAELYATPAEAEAELARRTQVRVSAFGLAEGGEPARFGGRPVRFGAAEREAFRTALAGWAAVGTEVWIAAATPEEEAAARAEVERVRGVASRVISGAWSEGCVLDSVGLAFLPARDALGTPLRRAAPRRAPRVLRDAFSDLKVGEPVVHQEYGIGLFRGVVPLSIEGVRQDFFLIEYADAEKLYLPADQAAHVQKYLGTGRVPALSRLGSEAWERTKARVAGSLRLYAAELLKLYAERAVASARGFGPIADAEAEFARTFPYEETPDQARTIAEVAGDLEKPKPMDRLVCGDVGYGKTEVMLRAAFRVALQGGQTAVLVPTTVLAQQHYRNFASRMQGTPITVGVLSRFLEPAERRRTLDALAQGTLDIVVGTHHLLADSVRFKSLGLVVVDEEHRFGVRQKERLKELKKSVHVLTMSATPIPRTLSMGLAGLRDLSVIETPPPGRLSVLTHVHEENPAVAREAVLREMKRGGQVFWLHNRVQTIMTCADRVRALVPEARVVVAHGQMPPGPFGRAMDAFGSGKADVLVCTSIIGAGLDLPNANTLIVERADTFGLADLYQLRGRVGRGARQAYAYFFFSPKGVPTLDARRRLAALLEFGELGSGFRLALRDLEIRGAGNLLGAQQHGALHAVGFDLYARLLDSAVRELKGEAVVEEHPPEISLGVEAYLPDGYVPDARSKLEIYKRLSACETGEALRALAAELADRFGPPPAPVARLQALAALRILGASRGLAKALRTGGTAILTFRSESALRAVLSAGARRGWRVEGLSLSLPVPADPDGAVAAIRGVLESVAAQARA